MSEPDHVWWRLFAPRSLAQLALASFSAFSLAGRACTMAPASSPPSWGWLIPVALWRVPSSAASGGGIVGTISQRPNHCMQPTRAPALRADESI